MPNVEGHHVVLSLVDAPSGADAGGAADELVQALHVLLPTRGVVEVLVQAVRAAEGAAQEGRPRVGMARDGGATMVGAKEASGAAAAPGGGAAAGGASGGRIPFGHIAITPFRESRQAGGGAAGGGAAGGGAAPKQAHVVQLLWCPPAPPPASLRLEPSELTFSNVLIRSADVRPGAEPPAPKQSQSFEIVNTGTAEMNFMLIIQKRRVCAHSDPVGSARSVFDLGRHALLTGTSRSWAAARAGPSSQARTRAAAARVGPTAAARATITRGAAAARRAPRPRAGLATPPRRRARRERRRSLCPRGCMAPSPPRRRSSSTSSRLRETRQRWRCRAARSETLKRGWCEGGHC